MMTTHYYFILRRYIDKYIELNHNQSIIVKINEIIEGCMYEKKTYRLNFGYRVDDINIYLL